MIETKNLAKEFKIRHEKKTTIFEKMNPFTRKERIETLKAIQNLNIQINKGECIGIIGRNGSGKTTLLKMISKILVPTKGKIKTRGNITSIIELGVGFQDDLTAKENTYLYGAIMGMTREAINKKMKEIMGFSELERFMDTKISSFSSGMRVRLSYSIAIQTDFDILILDEIFAVGDKNFQEKCIRKLEELKKQGKTIVLTSHNHDLIKKYTDKTLVLDKGKKIWYGETLKAIKKYEEIIK